MTITTPKETKRANNWVFGSANAETGNFLIVQVDVANVLSEGFADFFGKQPVVQDGNTM